MPRTALGKSFVVLGVVWLCWTAPGCTQSGQRGQLKVLTPEDKAHHQPVEVTLDDKATSETGTERLLATPRLDAGQSRTFTVKAVIRPNNYTTITRTRQAAVEAGQTVEVDLRKEDRTQPDDILVRFVPTPPEVVAAMLQLAGLSKDDVVYDLGCGDGRLVIAAVKSGARKGVGVDIDPKLVEQCKDAARKEMLEDRLEFREGDVLKLKDLPDATVVLLYMGHDLNKRLQPILQKELKPGARVVSHRFRMDDDWPPDQTENIRAKDNRGEDDDFEIHLWRIGDRKKE